MFFSSRCPLGLLPYLFVKKKKKNFFLGAVFPELKYLIQPSSALPTPDPVLLSITDHQGKSKNYPKVVCLVHNLKVICLVHNFPLKRNLCEDRTCYFIFQRQDLGHPNIRMLIHWDSKTPSCTPSEGAQKPTNLSSTCRK